MVGIVAIDATNWMHVLWHSYRERGATVVVGAMERWVSKLIDVTSPRHVLCCFDRRSFRYDLDDAYKKQREEKSPDLCHALDCAEEILRAHAMVVYQDGFEADDCLATAAYAGELCGQSVLLCSGDKDVWQCLVAGRVSALTKMGVESNKRQYMTAHDVEKRFGVRPSQWADFQALIGQPGDGIQGCDGFGVVTARKCLEYAGTLDNCLGAGLWSLPISERQRDALRRFSDVAGHVKQLVTLRCDVPSVFDALR